MKKKVFSLMMLFLVVFGFARANELTVYEGTVTNTVVPAFMLRFDDFTRSQYVIPAESIEAMNGGDIQSITWYTTSQNVPYTSVSTVDVYVTEVASASISAFVAKADCQIVYNGTLSFVSQGTSGKCVVTFSTPYHYNGGNLLIGCENITDAGYKSISFYGQTVSGASVGGYNANSLDNVTAAQRNFIPKTTFAYSGGGAPVDKLHVKYMDGDVEVFDALDLGVRPAGAWMAPFNFTMYSAGPTYIVNVLDFTPSDGLFTVSGEELPFQVIPDQDVALSMTTNSTEAGVIERQFVAITEGDRAAHVWPVTVELYAPEIPDVWEKACTHATTFPFVEVPATAHNTVLHNDYTLPFPEIEEGVDAVYKLVFTQDQMLNAEVIYGENGKVALYREGFEGEGGPMATNYYTGIEVGGGDTPGPGPGPQPGNNATVILTAGDVWGDGSGYQMLLDETHMLFGTTIPETGALSLNCSGNEAIYAQFSHKIPVNADGICSTQNMVMNNSVSIQIPAGTYDWCVTNPTPGDRIWIAGGNGNVGGRQDDFVFEAGKTYEFTCSLYSSGDGVNVVVSDGAKNKYAPLPAGEVKDIANVVPLTSGNTRDHVYTAGPVIQGLAVRPGTYYLVASSTTPDFQVRINAEAMPCPPVEGFAFNPTPADDADGLQPASVTLSWTLPDYTTSWRLVFGTTYYPEADHPQTIITDWSNELAQSYTVTNLWNNTNYFWHIEMKNDGCPEGMSSPIWGFTTSLNIPQNLQVNDNTIYEGDDIVLTWNPVVDRTYRRYYIYQDGVKIGETAMNQIDATSFTVSNLTYNMTGYNFYVTAVYDEGESAPSNTVNVQVTGMSAANGINGRVYEQDGMTGIANATVTVTGIDEFNTPRTYTFTTNNQGNYQGQVLAGVYNTAVASKDGYQSASTVHELPFTVVYQGHVDNVDFILDENFDGPCTVIAEYYPDSLDPQSPYVKVYWGCGLAGAEAIVEPFETGDFSQFDWQLDNTYPWSITTTNPYEGAYCMKSGNAGVASSVSTMSVTVEIPADGEMSFFGKISSESNWDYGYFYIDGQQMGSYSGAGNWVERIFGITAGEHTFKWSYEKDGSVNSNDDCFYVDNITFFRTPEPAPSGTLYTFDDGTLQGWTTFQGSNTSSPHSWIPGAQHYYGLSGYGHNASEGFVLSESYLTGDNVAVNPDNYLVSPLTTIENGSVLNFWASDANDLYGEEHFTVEISTTTNNNAAAFTSIFETTLLRSKGQRTGRSMRDVMNDGVWYEYNVDLSAYAGQQVYIAFHHFDCYDQWFLAIDDVMVTSGAKGINDRAFSHYRVYRTNCYNDGPYTTENTVVLACELHDTIYIDVDWPDVAPGIYKWGVGCVYSGNRGEEIESAITWAEPMAINNSRNDFQFSALNNVAVNHVGGNNGMNNRDGWLYYDDGELANAFGFGGSPIYIGAMFPAEQMAAYAGQSVTKVAQAFYSAAGGEIQIYKGGTDAPATLLYTQPYTAADITPSSTGEFTEFVLNQPVPVDATQSLWIVSYINNYPSTGSYPFAVSEWCGDDNGSWISGDGEEWMDFYSAVGGQADGTWMLRAYVEDGGTPGPGPGPGPTPGNEPIQEARESTIVWSNCLDKDMYLGESEVNITVLLNSADSPEGATVSFVNLNEAEQELYPVADVVLDESGYYAWESFRKGNYKLTLTMEGYETIIDENVSIWDATSLRYVMIEIIYGVDNLYVSRTGWAMWEGHGAVEPTPPGPGPEPGETFFDDFENGMGNWTLIDADGDGEGWYDYDPSEGLSLNAHSGSMVASSWSWRGSAVPYPGPDQYMISPMVEGATSVEYFVNTNPSYPDHYAVMASTTGTNVSDFSIVMEETAPGAKNGAMVSANDVTRGGYRGAWVARTVALPAGTKYVAFRHYDSYDENYLLIDDVTINTGAKNADDRHLESYKVMCTSIDGEQIFNTNTTHPFCQLTTDQLVEGERYICKVAAIYSTGVSPWAECIWEYASCTNYAGTANGVTVDGNTITWDYPGTPGPGPGPDPGETFTDDFESGDLSNWTLVDSDNDGENWETGTPASYGIGNAHSGTYCATSWSWNSYTYVPGPDNWMISPEVVGATSVSYYVATNTGYPDHYAIMASSTGTNISDFTMVFEEDAPIAKGGTANAIKSSITGGGHREMSPWTGRTIQLPSGTKYVAFRHYNSYDMNYLFIDDVTITAGAKRADVVVPDDLVITSKALRGRVGNFSNRDEWLTYDTNGEMNSAWGYNGNMFKMANYHPASQMAAYNGNSLTKVSFPAYCNVSGNIEIYQGGTTEPGTLVYTQSFTMTGSGEAATYNDITLTTPVTIDGSQSLWVVVGSDNYTDYPFINTTGAANPNGMYVYLDTYGWYQLTDVGGNGGPWMLRAYVEQGTTPPPTPAEGILGAMVFLNGEWEAFVPVPTNTYTFDEAGEYCVRIVYDGTNQLPSNNFYYAMSCEECTGVTPGTCEPGAPIHAEVLGATDQVKIWWGTEPAEPMSEWLYYDDDDIENASLLGLGGNMTWAVMFPAEALQAYNGCTLTEVAVVNGINEDYTPGTGTYTANIYLGGSNAPGTLVSTQAITANGELDWLYGTLSTPVTLDMNQNLWIVINQVGIDYPAVCTGSACPNANGRWIQYQGSWYDLAAISDYSFGWFIRGFVTNQRAGGSLVALPDNTTVSEGTLSQMTGVDFSNVVFNTRSNRSSIVRYNVYRSDAADGTYEYLNSVAEDGSGYYQYIDTPATAGTYYYQVTAVYDDDCESLPAPAYDDPTHNYVSANVNAVGENSDKVALYPNPTKGNVTIEANGMSRITVVSVLGQVIFDAEVNADVYTLNMAQFKAGMYLVRVSTENGVTVKRVTVM